MSMKVKSLGPPFILGVKKCDPPPGSSKIYSDPPLLDLTIKLMMIIKLLLDVSTLSSVIFKSCKVTVGLV